MINIGDVVEISMSTNNAFSWQQSPYFTGVVLHSPADTGDLLYLDNINGVGEGHPIAINTNSSDFVGLTVIQRYVP